MSTKRHEVVWPPGDMRSCALQAACAHHGAQHGAQERALRKKSQDQLTAKYALTMDEQNDIVDCAKVALLVCVNSCFLVGESFFILIFVCRERGV